MLGMRVRVVNLALCVAQVVCASGVCVGADAVDKLRGVVGNAVVGDVERSEQVERGVSVGSDGSRPEARRLRFGLSFGAL